MAKRYVSQWPRTTPDNATPANGNPRRARRSVISGSGYRQSPASDDARWPWGRILLRSQLLGFLGGSKQPSIPDAGVGGDDPGPSWIGLDLPPELTDEAPQHVDIARVPRSPDVLEQPVVGEQLPGMPG